LNIYLQKQTTATVALRAFFLGEQQTDSEESLSIDEEACERAQESKKSM
jgi:hypothetical protein